MHKLIRISLLTTLLLASCSISAFSWDDLWLRSDQQGEKAMNAGDAKKAASLFKSKKWQGIANYRAGNYQKALDDFTKDKSSHGDYNQGNALAQMGKYQEALDAYNKALAKAPGMADAKHNKAIVEKMLKQQSNKKNNKNQSDKSKQKKQNKNKNKQQQNSTSNDSQKQNSQQQQQQQQQQQNNTQQKKDNKTSPQKMNKENKPSQSTQSVNEQKQATEQWLRGIPDNPGGLLQQKFLRDHQNYQALQQQGQQPW